MASVIDVNDVIFPESSSNFSATLSSLKRSTLSISNRLASICDDAQFVNEVAESYGLPLIANERCGSWYIESLRKTGSAYFKSTDGHNGQWSFSLRRLNIQVFGILKEYNGCIIVDSTRRGKSMPDALSKTVPIWCTVMNRIFFPHLPESHDLSTPLQCVSASEHTQIEDRINDFVRHLETLNPILDAFRDKLTKPLRPFWVTRDSSLPSLRPCFMDCHPVILCTASRRVIGGEMSAGGYIQGAGDDSEGWARGLTPHIFWKYKEELINTPESELPDLITILLSKPGSSFNNPPSLINPTTWLKVGTIDYVAQTPWTGPSSDAVIYCGDSSLEMVEKRLKGRSLHIKCSSGKLGSRDLRKQLPKLRDFMLQLDEVQSIFVCCHTGKDLSLGVALVLLCLHSNTDGSFLRSTDRTMGKAFIRQKMNWITLSMPTANPSRATLQSVNAFLLSP